MQKIMQRKSSLSILVALCIGTTGALSGCASNGPYQTSTPYSESQYNSAGYIESIHWVDGDNRTSIAGAVIGGIVGAALGNQVGGGNGRAAATVAGGVGGAIVGNQIEHGKSGSYYQVAVRLDNGNRVFINQNDVNNLRTGERARIVNGRVYQN